MLRPIILVLLLCSAAPVQAQLLGDLVHQRITFDTQQTRIEQDGRSLLLQSAGTSMSYDGVIFQGVVRGDSEGLRGEVRFRDAEGWSEWIALYITTSVTDGFFMAGYPGDVVRKGGRIEARFVVPSGDELAHVEGGVFFSALDELGSSEVTDEEATVGGTSNLIIPPVMHDRA